MLHPNESIETAVDKQTSPSNTPSTGILEYIRAVGASALVLMVATEAQAQMNRPQTGNQPRGAAAQRAPTDGSVYYVDSSGKEYVGFPASNAELAQFNAQKASFPGWTTFILNGQRYIGIPPTANGVPAASINNQVRSQASGANGTSIPVTIVKKDPKTMTLADRVDSASSSSLDDKIKAHIHTFYQAAAPALSEMAASKDAEVAKDANTVLEALSVAVVRKDLEIIFLMNGIFGNARVSEKTKGRFESEFLPSGVHEAAKKWEALRVSNPDKYSKETLLKKQ